MANLSVIPRSIRLITLVCCLGSAEANDPTPRDANANPDSASAQRLTDAQALSEMRAVVEQVEYPALISVDETGQPRARTVDAFTPDDNWVVWVATKPNTRKVTQIREHPAVTLYYFDVANRNYVTVMGTAELVNDDQVKSRMRRDSDHAGLYPDFPHDYLLIKITPSIIEGLIPSYRGDPSNWAPFRVDLTGG